jgi:hypothetical protein
MSVRPALVSNAVAFLQHPSVSSISSENRASFLREKGLSEQEIAESFRQVNLAPPAPIQTIDSGAGTSRSTVVQVLQWIGVAGAAVAAGRWWSRQASLPSDWEQLRSEFLALEASNRRATLISRTF